MRYRCRHCGGPKGLEYEDATGTGQCPKCGRPPGRTVHALTDVHFMVLGQGGPIAPSREGSDHDSAQGYAGTKGLYIACQVKRDCLARRYGIHPQMVEPFSATDDPRSVTCPACHRTKPWQDMAVLFPELAPILHAAKHGRTVALIGA
jgi:hypothetical protein